MDKTQNREMGWVDQSVEHGVTQPKLRGTHGAMGNTKEEFWVSWDIAEGGEGEQGGKARRFPRQWLGHRGSGAGGMRIKHP